jgi:uncharacterized membrane protein YphA (DoxX/SURF4 family)
MEKLKYSRHGLADPAYQAYKILQAAFVLIFLLAGLDKFFNAWVDWTKYLALFISNLVAAPVFMRIAGVVEIAAGLLIVFKPRLGATIVASWLAGIILNLLLVHGYYDVVLRDFALLLGSLALLRLSVEFER